MENRGGGGLHTAIYVILVVSSFLWKMKVWFGK